MKKTTTIPSYTHEDTSDPNLKRYVDRYGDWTHYFLVKENVYLPAVNYILGLGYAKGPRFYEYLLSVTKDEAKKRLESAGDEGSRSHAAIRDLINGSRVTMSTKYPSDMHDGRQQVLNPDEWDNIKAWTKWCDKYNPRLVSNEFSVCSVKYGYAGSPDGLMVLTVPSADKAFPKEFWGKDVLVMPDWKTSGAIYNEYGAQLAAYFEAMVQGGKFDAMLNAYKGRTFTAVVRIGTRHKNGGFEMQVHDLEQTEQNFRRFLAAKEIFADNAGEFDHEPEQIPTEFFVRIPKAKVEKPKAVKRPKKEKLKRIEKSVKDTGEEEQGALPLI